MFSLFTLLRTKCAHVKGSKKLDGVRKSAIQPVNPTCA
jgi:hypothetical protein